MTAIPLGPITLPAGPVLLLVAAALAIHVADRLPSASASASVDDTRGASARPGNALLHAVYAALVAARLMHVGLNLDAYAASPWTVIDVRDGGWHPASGFIAGLAWVAWHTWRRPRWRNALAIGTVTGLSVWTAGTVLLAPPDAEPLPDLALIDLHTGAPVRLRNLADGRPVVLNLWATWCPPCRREMPILAEAQRTRTDVVFVFANQGESADTVRRYLAGENLQLSSVLLGDGSLARAIGSRGLPTTVFYDDAGRRVDAHMGALNTAALAVKLRAAAGR